MSKLSYNTWEDAQNKENMLIFITILIDDVSGWISNNKRGRV